MKTAFKLEKFMLDKRMNPNELAQKLDVHPDTIYKILRRGTMKISMVAKIESQFGNCEDYLKEQRLSA